VRSKKAGKKFWITIGSFDGIHLGHQRIISNLVENAHADGSHTVLITFFPNPAVFLKKIQEAYYLTTPEEKEQLIYNLGIDLLRTLPFDQELAKTRAREFIHQLHTNLQFTNILVGSDFHFGVNREGDIHTLESLGKDLDFNVVKQVPIFESKKRVSSSQIRNLLKRGDVKRAALILGRHYSILGKVMHGDGRGKKLGIPTANISTWQRKLLPAQGVYVAIAHIGKNQRGAIVNIGTRPTFYQKTSIRTTEAYLLDWKEDFYGKQLNLEFICRLRPENKFDSANALMNQIHQDIQRSREILTHVIKEKHLSA